MFLFLISAFNEANALIYSILKYLLVLLRGLIGS